MIVIKANKMQVFLSVTLQIAGVLNYVRSSWGNKIPGVVTPGIIKVLRK